MPKGVYARKPVEEPSEVNDAMREVMGQVAEWSTATPATLPAADPNFDIRAEMERELAEIRALKTKLELQTTVRSEVSEALRLQQEETRRKEFGKPTPTVHVIPPKPEGARMVPVKLERHYAPEGYYEIVGYHKDPVFRKFPDGQTREVEPAAFIPGEKKPPQIAGVGFPGKIWSGTVLRLVSDEAKTVAKAKIGTIELED